MKRIEKALDLAVMHVREAARSIEGTDLRVVPVEDTGEQTKQVARLDIELRAGHEPIDLARETKLVTPAAHVGDEPILAEIDANVVIVVAARSGHGVAIRGRKQASQRDRG